MTLISFISTYDDREIWINPSKVYTVQHGYEIHSVGRSAIDGSDKRAVFHKAGTSRVYFSATEEDGGVEVYGTLAEVAAKIRCEAKQ